MRTSILMATTIASLLFLGCNDSSSSQSLVTDSTDITVERGPVLNAAVMDANGQIGEHLGNGVYRFTEPVYPVESYGGYIDMNRNGTVDVGDIEMQQLRLRTKAGNVMTMVTTLDENVSDSLLNLGFSEDELSGETPSSDIDIAALSDELYQYCYENNISDPSTINVAQMETLQQRIQERKSFYQASDLESYELEDDLMEELNVDILTDSDLENISTDAMTTIINAIPLATLTEEQKYTLAYMWNEEKMAKDVYLALNELTASNTLYNIATNAESKHMLAVEGIIEKYDINILNVDGNYSGGYNQAELAAYQSGDYSLSEITDLYASLYEKGSSSLQDALEVGCMVEVTDINDLNADIELIEGVQDITLIFENLRNASYSHYWSFNKALKSIGVTEGCCVLGEEFCKTEDEYPREEKGH